MFWNKWKFYFFVSALPAVFRDSSFLHSKNVLSPPQLSSSYRTHEVLSFEPFPWVHIFPYLAPGLNSIMSQRFFEDSFLSPQSSACAHHLNVSTQFISQVYVASWPQYSFFATRHSSYLSKTRGHFSVPWKSWCSYFSCLFFNHLIFLSSLWTASKYVT